MAQYGDQYGHVENHEVGNPTVYENTGANMAERGVVTHEATNGLSSVEHPQTQIEKLHRSGVSSSSSSEDEGEGGIRKKKGLTEKIKEKIPGVGPKEQSHNTTTKTTPTTTMLGGKGEHGEEKKGMVDKIKEKLPGHK